MPSVTVVERDYPNLYTRFTSLGPLMNKLGNGGKGIGWNTDHEVELLGGSTARVTARARPRGSPHRDRHRRQRGDPEPGTGDQRRSRGQGLGSARQNDRAATTPICAIRKEDEKIRFRDIVAQPRKIISSPTWSGIESETGLLQCRLHQRARTDPLAHADRPPAALSGPSLDARVRRGLLRLSAAGRHQGTVAGHDRQAATATPRSC